jgi:predicted RNA-binding Zn-ribbon protein involved in translation (DUF1610 family)
MAYTRAYRCTGCNEVIPREQMTVKHAVFKTPGTGPKVIKSRTTEWLCPPCLAKDADWNIDAHDAPAYQM